MKLVPNEEFITQQKHIVSDFKKGKLKVSKRKSSQEKDMKLYEDSLMSDFK